MDEQEQQAPEVCRTPLEQLCLTVKTRFGPEHKLHSILSQMLTPPEAAASRSAVQSLSSLGALDGEEALTPLGRLLSQIPMDPRLAKTCIFACMLRSDMLLKPIPSLPSLPVLAMCNDLQAAVSVQRLLAVHT